MKCVITRVSQAQVHINGSLCAQIGEGVLALIGIEKEDTAVEAERLLERILGYRIFPDQEQRMEYGLKDTKGELLLVPQFTLAANTRKGNKGDFSNVASHSKAEPLFDHLVNLAQKKHGASGARVACGKFGAMMEVSSVNSGPVTFILETRASS